MGSSVVIDQTLDEGRLSPDYRGCVKQEAMQWNGLDSLILVPADGAVAGGSWRKQFQAVPSVLH